MAETHLGTTIDIHGGGQDLVFPHHENEVAQSTCAHGGQLYCRYWVHNGLIHVDSEKMSKSIGNVLLVRDLLEEAPGEVIRLGLLTAHYRQPLDWSADVLTEARQKLDRMYGALRGAGITGAATDEDGADAPAGVLDALEDDLNSPRALAELFTLARDANRAEDPAVRLARARELRAGARLLGLLEQDPEAWFTGAASGSLGEAEIDSLVAKRESLRHQRQFAEADAIRDRLAAQGIVIEDGAAGTRWRRAR
jgi:cysteinyl-tRNA synthetase